MNLLDKVVKALTPFALPPRTLPEVNPARAAAAEALAAVREAQANPQGFEEWWGQYGRKAMSRIGMLQSKDAAQVAYLAGQLSGIPAEMRETLIEACIEAEGAHMAASSMWRDYAEHKAQDEADAAKRVAEARKWLEDSCSTQTK